MAARLRQKQRRRMRYGCAAAACALLMPMLYAAQQPDASAPTKSKDPAQTTPAKKGAARPADAQAPDAPQPPTPQQAPAAKPDAAADNPFPEDVSQGAAAVKAKEGDNPDAPAAPDAARSSSGRSRSGSSSSDSSSSSSSEADSNSSSSSNSGASSSDPNAEPDVPAHARRRLGKPSAKDIQSGSLAGEGRAEEDVRIGRYYLSQHNYPGAYGRFEEAARLDPASVEAIYGVAASAEGLHKTDEAVENYKLYLQVAPDGEYAKLAQRSLKVLSK